MAGGLFWNYAAQLLYNPILALVKLSILVFLYRLAGHRASVLYSVSIVGICESRPGLITRVSSSLACATCKC